VAAQSAESISGDVVTGGVSNEVLIEVEVEVGEIETLDCVSPVGGSSADDVDVDDVVSGATSGECS